MYKRALSFLLALCMIVSLCPVMILAAETDATAAASGICGDHLTWVLEDGVLTISGTGAMYDFGEEWPGWYGEDVETVVVESGVTTLGAYAFFSCPMTSLSLPDTLTAINDSALYACRNLRGTINIGANVTYVDDYAITDSPNIEAIEVAADNPNYASVEGVLFDKNITRLIRYPGGKATTDYVVPETVYQIFCGSMSEVAALQTVTVGAGVYYIDTAAFGDCQSLTGVYVDENNQRYYDVDGIVYSKDDNSLLACPAGYPTEDGTFTIPEGIAAIEPEAFRGCTFTKVTLPASMKTLGSLAFTYMYNLETVDLAGVEVIENHAFQGCRMDTLTIPATVTEIGGYLFGGSSGPDIITFLGEAPALGLETNWAAPFREVTTTAYYPANLAGWTEEMMTSYGGDITWIPYEGEIPDVPETPEEGTDTEGTYGGVHWCLEDGYLTLSGAADMEDQADATGYPWYACRNEIQRIFIYEVTSVGDHAFEEYPNLEYFMTDSATRIGAYAFAGTTAMTDCNLSENLTSIEAYAFSGSSIHYVHFHSDPPAIDETAFTGVTANAAYPYGNTNWTEDVMLNYGGELNWMEVPDTVAAGEWEEGYWEVMSDGQLSVYNWGSDAPVMSDQTSADAYPWYEYAEVITDIYVGENWTNIGANAFAGYPNLTCVNIGPSVTAIGANAFADNAALTDIFFQGDAPVIDGTAFTGVTAGAYYNSSNSGWTEDVLQNHGGEITWYEQVEVMGGGPFGDGHWEVSTDGRLELYNWSSDAAVMPDYDSAQEYPWGELVDRITSVYVGGNWANVGENAFAGYPCLESIVVGPSVTSVGAYAFAYNDNLTEIQFTGDAPAIDETAFTDVTALVVYYDTASGWDALVNSNFGGDLSWGEINTGGGEEPEEGLGGICGENLTWQIENGTLTISGSGEMYDYDFQGAPWYEYAQTITTVRVEDGVTSIGSYAFLCFYDVTDMDIADSVTKINTGAFHSCGQLTGLDLPDSLTEIGKDAFLGCADLQSIVIPEGVISIGRGAFFECYGLTEVVLPQSLATIDIGAFIYCSNLPEITIPAGVTSIGIGAFNYCSDLETVYFQGDAPTVIEQADSAYEDVFEGVSATAYYPAGNDTWTEEAKADFGGKITWVAACVRHEVVTDAAVAPTCTETGLTEGSHCGLCGKTLVAQEVIPATGHNLGDWYTVENPTCTEPGSCRRDCSKCDYFESGIVDALGHTAVTNPAVDPTCTETGWTEGSHCEACGLILVEQEVIPATGHSYVGGVCEVCGHVNLAAPVVKASNVASSGKNKLTWNAVEGAVSYNVYRSTSKTGTYTKLKNTTGTSFTNTGAVAGNTYYYYVEAVAADGSVSEASNIVTRTCDYARPVVKVTNVASSGKIKLSWNEVEGATSYKIYRSTSKTGTYSLIKTATSTSFTNTSVEAGTLYYYYVIAAGSKSAANSAKSSVVSRTCDLPRPTVTVTNVASSGKIKVSWNAVEGAVSYKVYRSTSSDGTYSLVKTTTGTSYTNTSAVAGNTYYYKVVAVAEKSAANSAYSSVKSRTCDLARPNVSIALKSGKPRLTWTAIDGAVSYKIYRSTSKDGTYSLIKTTTSTSYTNTGAKSGVTYYYKVIAVHSKSAANSAYSLVDSIKSK